MILRDEYGFPVELLFDRPVLNFFRRLIHTDIEMTWRLRNDPWPPPPKPDPNVGSSP